MTPKFGKKTNRLGSCTHRLKKDRTIRYGNLNHSNEAYMEQRCHISKNINTKKSLRIGNLVHSDKSSAVEAAALVRRNNSYD